MVDSRYNAKVEEFRRAIHKATLTGEMFFASANALPRNFDEDFLNAVSSLKIPSLPNRPEGIADIRGKVFIAAATGIMSTEAADELQTMLDSLETTK